VELRSQSSLVFLQVYNVNTVKRQLPSSTLIYTWRQDDRIGCITSKDAHNTRKKEIRWYFPRRNVIWVVSLLTICLRHLISRDVQILFILVVNSDATCKVRWRHWKRWFKVREMGICHGTLFVVLVCRLQTCVVTTSGAEWTDGAQRPKCWVHAMLASLQKKSWTAFQGKPKPDDKKDLGTELEGRFTHLEAWPICCVRRSNSSIGIEHKAEIRPIWWNGMEFLVKNDMIWHGLGSTNFIYQEWEVHSNFYFILQIKQIREREAGFFWIFVNQFSFWTWKPLQTRELTRIIILFEWDYNTGLRRPWIW